MSLWPSSTPGNWNRLPAPKEPKFKIESLVNAKRYAVEILEKLVKEHARYGIKLETTVAIKSHLPPFHATSWNCSLTCETEKSLDHIGFVNYLCRQQIAEHEKLQNKVSEHVLNTVAAHPNEVEWNGQPDPLVAWHPFPVPAAGVPGERNGAKWISKLQVRENPSSAEAQKETPALAWSTDLGSVNPPDPATMFKFGRVPLYFQARLFRDPEWPHGEIL
jgi:DNA-directed RNA polymerase subunit N (RpoN/RPB10)